MPSCAFSPCHEVQRCPLPGGCVNHRFTRTEGHHVIPASKALNGTLPARTIRDPRLIKRKRKALR